MDFDDAYANAKYIAGAEDYPPRWEAAAGEFRKAQADRARIGLSYGDSDRQAFDLFRPADTARGTAVFIHGGYWRAFDRSAWSHLAAGPLAHGWAVAMPGYDLCPDVRIADITRQMAAAVTAIAKETDGPIVLAGHSAGGHLTARMMERGLLPGQVAERIVLAVPISPLSDLSPLMHTSMNDDLQLEPGEAAAESPVNMDARLCVPVAVWVGAEERPAFLDQARWLSEAWGADLVLAPGRHHFDVIDALSDPESVLVRLLTSCAR